jgi:hypothetical protein
MSFRTSGPTELLAHPSTSGPSVEAQRAVRDCGDIDGRHVDREFEWLVPVRPSRVAVVILSRWRSPRRSHHADLVGQADHFDTPLWHVKWRKDLPKTLSPEDRNRGLPFVGYAADVDLIVAGPGA